ncbi:sensor histidine kinase [Aquimarina sp. AU58]|uniref:sensor histidine kinase n=1 Tax=Aquimarina sp. AU58 TaxID=1874112 RepID=UPI000D653750|nr:histidine kinase [Aquimarina sp. AU58]
MIIGSIALLTIITLITYIRVKELSFLYYSLYAMFLNIYLSFKFMYNITVPESIYSLIIIMNWPVLLIESLLYAQFIRTFFNLEKKNPKLDNFTKRYIWMLALILLSFSLVNYFFLSNDLKNLTSLFIKFTLYFFIPLYLPVSIYMLYRAMKLDNPAKNFIALGSVMYGLSILVSFYFDLTDRLNTPPMLILGVGVFIEFLFFAIALGVQINVVFLQKRRYQKGLIHQLETNKKLIERHNFTLKEEVKKKSIEIEILTRKELEMKFKNRIDELRSRVYRSQMNSHFIFNTLNSIKGAIVSEKKEDSIEQLNKFSKLIRNILNNSRLEEVTLKEEIEITRLYFFLENLRFENKINFDLKINPPPQSLTSIKVPPFILQPFLENAVWHGLANKSGEKNLELAISLLGDTLLNIIIKDNGVGMVKSASVNKKRHRTHKSMGIDITRERLELFSKNNLKDFNLDFENIGSIHNSKGTKVILNIPIS